MSENEILRTLPILPLRGMMVFPYMMVHLDAGRDPSISGKGHVAGGASCIFAGSAGCRCGGT